MKNINLSKLWIPLFIITISCSSNSYLRIRAQDAHRIELEVSSDRVVAYCEKASDESELYMFSVYALDEQDTVIDIPQVNILDKKICFERAKRAQKLISGARKLFIRGLGSLKVNKDNVIYEVKFPKYGMRKTNQQMIGFFGILNEKGECILDWQSNDPPCGQEGFPIKK